MQNTNSGGIGIILSTQYNIIIVHVTVLISNYYNTLMYLKTAMHRHSAKWRLNPIERQIYQINI